MAPMVSSMSRAPIAVCCCVSLMLFLGAEALADSPDWVLEAIEDATLDPAEIHYFHGVHRDCPLGDEHAQRIIEEVLTRNRIEPRHLALSRDLSEHLVVDLWVSCLDRGDLSFIYVIDAYLALHSPLNGRRLFIGQRFGRFGTGNRAAILQSIEDSIEDAASAYLEANKRR